MLIAPAHAVRLGDYQARSRGRPQAAVQGWEWRTAEFHRRRASWIATIYHSPARCSLRILRSTKSRLSALMRKMKRIPSRWSISC